MLDATLVAARHAPPAPAAGLGAKHPKEPEADWTRKGGKAHFGYKAHVGVDAGSGLVRSVEFTSAKVNDGEVADGLICGDEAAVYADKAYEQKQRRARLKAAGIKDRIMHRRHKHIARLPHWQQRRNDLIARRRAPVEAVFSAGKRLYGLGRARYASLAPQRGARWPSSPSTTCAARRCSAAREGRSASCVALRVTICLPRPPSAASPTSKCAISLPTSEPLAFRRRIPRGEGAPKGRMRGPSCGVLQTPPSPVRPNDLRPRHQGHAPAAPEEFAAVSHGLTSSPRWGGEGCRKFRTTLSLSGSAARTSPPSRGAP